MTLDFIQTCDACKNWNNPQERGVGTCDKLTHAPDNKGCVVYSDSDPIYTEPKFGCIHWEKKDA